MYGSLGGYRINSLGEPMSAQGLQFLWETGAILTALKDLSHEDVHHRNNAITRFDIDRAFRAQADSSDRPAHVEAKNWIPISDRLGFVVDTPISSQRVRQNSPYGAAAALSGRSPPLEGYFEAKTQTGWRRLAVTQPSDLLH
jgi:hypothetical protein